jgi:hypothetical protein
MSESRILVRLLRMFFPRNYEFGSALSKLRNFPGRGGRGGFEHSNPPPPRYATALMYTVRHVDKYKITFKIVINRTNEILQHIVVSSGLSGPGIIDARIRYQAAARRLRNTAIVLAVRLPHSSNISYLSALCPARVAEAQIANLFVVINTEMLKRLKNSHLVVLKASEA